jgi:lipoprotein-anchoring transpeptidase ErfK/SrfK
MSPSVRRPLLVLAAVAALAALALSGYLVVRARAAGSGGVQVPAAVLVPSTAPSGAGGTPAPEYERWMVGKATAPLVVRRRPAADAAVKVRLGARNQNDYPTLVLVDIVREVAGVTWYRVWVAVRPNGSRGWVKEGPLAFYTTSAKIVIDLSERKLSVYRRGELKGEYPVAVGRPGLETPTGFYFVNQKLKPPAPGGAYGALAIGISAFQPKLSGWAQGGPVAIHGTNQPELIGQAISHGCVRMRDKDVLAVSKLVPAGSPVIVQK